jgi:hypothetical protein
MVIWKNRKAFVENSDAGDLEMAFVKVLKDVPERIVMVILSGRSESSLISTLQFMLTLFLYATMPILFSWR